MTRPTNRFLNEEGLVVQWPSRPVDREAVCAYLADKFAPGHSYTEAEVNELLKLWHTFGDWSLLRRELYERRFLDRDPAGRDYRRTSKPAESAR
ncbi:MAG TPA: DUF2087 domain-containing protein [Candidatus Saccharimonas sp.]|nr:DUF2087 domain-containing protein [Candidatus Saccharimonas sp.]